MPSAVALVSSACGLISAFLGAYLLYGYAQNAIAPGVFLKLLGVVLALLGGAAALRGADAARKGLKFSALPAGAILAVGVFLIACAIFVEAKAS